MNILEQEKKKTGKNKEWKFYLVLLEGAEEQNIARKRNKPNFIFGKIEGDVALMKQRAFELHKVNNNNRIGRKSQEKLLVSKTKRKINEK